METLQELKQELLEKIAGIEDYDVLQALREDVATYEKQATEEGPYDFPGATDEEREELIKEDKGEISIEEDYHTHEDFKKAMSRWLTK